MITISRTSYYVLILGFIISMFVVGALLALDQSPTPPCWVPEDMP